MRHVEIPSIREFLVRHQEFLRGRVLDYGCGLPHNCRKPQPYRNLVQGEYVPYDVQGYPHPQGQFDAVLCTQVMQYVPDPAMIIRYFSDMARFVVMTYPTLWEEVERNDRWRFTKLGMEALLIENGFSKIWVHEARWFLPFDGLRLAGGYGVVAER